MDFAEVDIVEDRDYFVHSFALFDDFIKVFRVSADTDNVFHCNSFQEINPNE